MRKVPYVRAESAVPMAEFNIHIAPQANASAPPPAASAGCDPRKCPWWPYTNAKEFKANTALILVVLFCALICALAFNAAIRYLIRLHCGGGRRRGGQKEEIGGGASEEEAEVPALIFAEGMKLAGGETECIICLSEFAAGEKIRVLDRCSHGFHLECVQRWLASRSSCPTCRANCASEEANESTP